MEIVFGFIVMGISVAIFRFIEKVILRSKNPVVNFLLMAAGTAATISLAKDLANWLRKDDK